ncbi:MAG: PIG-L family deacetylase [Ignavibacteriales bacterium]|nr:PIG-L family deacetylase [Ignavibacteriales bacterium]
MKHCIHFFYYPTLLIIFFTTISSTTLIAQQQSKHSVIVVITPHPDDAEASCGGLIANYTSAGKEVIILTMTGGERGIWNASMDEARKIRTEEARNAANALGAKIEFFGAIDGSLAADSANNFKLKEILQKINPAIVFAPWPLDVHPDHQATGILAWRAFQDKRFSFDLYFYETSNSPHTKSFQFVPTDYVDITGVMEKKREATYKHKSQSPEEWFGMYEIMARANGYSADVTFAEAYIKARNSSGLGERSAVVNKTLNK